MPVDSVTRETELLTDTGYVPVGALEGKSVKAWGNAEVTVQKQAKEPLVRVWFEDGAHLDCGERQTFYTEYNERKPALGLKNGEKLQRVLHPKMALPTDLNVKTEIAYVSGFATFAGYEDNNRLALSLPDSIPDQMFKRLVTPSVDVSLATQFAAQIRYEPRTIKAGYAPLRWDVASRLMWLSGAMDAVGQWIELDGDWWLTLATHDQQLIVEMRRLALELAMLPRIRITDLTAAFMLDAFDANWMIHAGLMLGHEQRVATGRQALEQYQPIVTDVHPLPWQMETYSIHCEKQRVILNGIYAGSEA